MYCNEYFDFAARPAKLNAAAQIFEYGFLVKRPLPALCFLFEHFLSKDRFHATGDHPLVPTTDWPPGLYVHRTRQFVPEGDYEWWVGLVQEGTGNRMPIAGTKDNRIPLGRVKVGPLAISAAREALRHYVELLPNLHRCRLAVYASKEGALVAWPDRGPNPNKAAVISIPKAGTYLLEKLLGELGCQGCRIHLSLAHCNDYRNATLKDQANVTIPLRASLTTQLVSPGQAIVGHVAHCLETQIALSDFRKLFAFRNLRDAIVSGVRFAARMDSPIARRADLNSSSLTDPEKCLKYLEVQGQRDLETYAAVLGWRDEPGVLSVRFEDLLGDNGSAKQLSCVAEISKHVGAPVSEVAVLELLARVIGSETPTYSGRRTDRRPYWNAEVERRFVEIGLRDLNRRLGYPDDP